METSLRGLAALYRALRTSTLLPTQFFTMGAYFSIACIVLKSITIAVTSLNELVLCTSQWIISPSHPPTPFPYPLYTSIAYALAEPLYAILITRMGVQAWINLLGTSQHFWVCQLAMDYIVYVINSQRPLPTRPPEISTTGEAGEKRTFYASETQPDHSEAPRSVWQTYVAVLFPVQSTAACNAALLLFASDLDASLRHDNANVILFFSGFAIVIYLGSRYADFTISHRTYKVSLWKPRSHKNLALQLGCLVLLLSLKTGIRILLGLHPFPLLQDIGSTEVRPILGQETPPWIETVQAWTPTWFPLATSIISPPLTLFGFWLTQRALREQ